MQQLVGSACLLCQSRIDTSLDGGFCVNCGQASHFGCRQTAAEVEGKCAGCSAPFDLHAAKRRADEQQAAAKAAIPQPLNLSKKLKQIRLLYRLVRLLALSIVFLVLGVLLVASPGFRRDPQQISGSDIVRGITTCLAGSTIALYGLWNFRVACRQLSRDEESTRVIPASEFQRGSRSPDDQPWTCGRQGDRTQ
jgi:hypothetical protein